jgi:hypothetical protein
MLREVGLLFLWVLAGGLMAGCSSNEQIVEPRYVIGLEQVQLQSEPDWSKYTVRQRDTTAGVQTVYRDSTWEVRFYPFGGRISMKAANRSESIIRIQVQDGLYIGPESSPQELVTGEMSYSARNASPRPTILRPSAEGSAELIPLDHVSFLPKIGASLDQTFFPPPLITTMEQVEKARSNVGKNLSLILPVETRASTRQYRFGFSVKDVILPPDDAVQALISGTVTEGIHKSYVRQIKGEPRVTDTRDGRLVWYYGTVTDRTKIFFEDDHVAEIR